MKKLTIKQLDEIMQNFSEFAKIINMKDGDRGFIATEQAFVYGAACALLGLKPKEILFHHLPPIVEMCFLSGRPLSSVMAVGREESTRLKRNNLPAHRA